MYPVFIEIGGFAFETYGVVTVLGYAVMIAFILKESQRVGLPSNTVIWCVALATLGTMVGGRLTYLIVHFSFFMEDPSRFLRFWEGGLVSFGGFVGMQLFVAVYGFRARAPVWTILDLAAMSGVLAMAMGRWGCFFAGCDYGIPAGENFPLSVVFQDPRSALPPHLLGVALHPVQLYLSAANLAVLGLGYGIHRRFKAPGGAFGAVAVSYSVLRFSIETLRGDADRGIWWGGALSTSQIMGIGWFLVGVGALVLVFGRRRRLS